MEYPVVADVDGDGRAEILLPSNKSFGGDTSTQGLHVPGHPSWQGTRPIWNQYGYHVTNVALDGTVPAPQLPPWQSDNVFRANRELAAPPLLLGNLTVSFPRVGAAAAEGVPVTLRIGNGGRAAVPAGAVVELFDAASPSEPVGSGTTPRALGPGAWEDLVVQWTAAGAGAVPAFATVDRDDAVAECDETDNRVDFELTETVLPDPAIVAGGVAAPSPAAAGGLVPVAVTLENLGAAATPDLTVRLYDGDPARGIVLGEALVPVLGVGERRTDTVFWDTHGMIGLHLVHAVVDPDGVIGEFREDNNRGLVAVELLAPTAPDLTVESFSAEPPAVESGQPVRLVADVRNRGAGVDVGFTVAFRVNNAEAGRVEVPGLLAAGDSRPVELEIGTASLAGVANIEVRLDPDDAIAELDESNNRATAELEVGASGLAVTVATDRLGYGPLETVAITVSAHNLGDTTRSVVVAARVADAFGAVVAELADQPLDLAPGVGTLDFSWNTGNTLPGSYAVRVGMFEDDAPRAAGNALFNIAGEVATDAVLFTDRDVYTPLQPVVLFGNVANTSPNTVLVDLEARLSIEDAAGVEVFTAARSLAALYPGSSSPMNGFWEIAGAPSGVYTASLSLRDAGGELLAYASALVTVEDSGQTGAGLAGDLTASPELLGAGAPLLVTWQVSNGGNAGMPDLELRIDLVRLADGFVAASRTVPQPLAVGETAAGGLGFATFGLAENDYLATLVGVLPGAEVRLDRDAFATAAGISIADAEIAEGDGGSAQLLLNVGLTSIREAPVTVEFTTLDGTATAGEDYAATSGTLSFAPGELQQQIAVTVFGDLDPEADEVFVVRLGNASGALLGDDQALAILRDEEGCASRDLLLGGDAELEGTAGDPLPGWDTSGDGGWRRRFGAPTPLSGQAAIGYGGEAASGELVQLVDLTPFAARIDAGRQELLLEAFVHGSDTPPGDGARVLVEYLDGDLEVLDLVDSGELFPGAVWTAVVDRRLLPAGTRAARVHLEIAEHGGDGAAVYFDRVALRSLGVPTLAVDDTEVMEGDGGSVSASFPVTLSCSQGTLELSYVTTDGDPGSTATAGVDYQAASGDLSLAPGQTTGAIAVTVLGDTTDEPDEDFRLLLSTATTDLVLLDGLGRGTIRDDDGPAALAVADVNVAEGDAAGAMSAEVPVTLSAASGQTVRVSYATVAGSAAAPGDFTSTSGTLVFAPGSTELTVLVPITGDRVAEADEAFTVVLSAPIAATIAGGEATVTVFDDDDVELSVVDASVVEGDDGSARAEVRVETSLDSTLEITVAYATADGDALAVDDYTAGAGVLTFAAGVRVQTVQVAITGDLVVEPLESFRLVLATPTNAVLGDPEGNVSILDDDGLLLSIADVTVSEGALGDPVEAIFQLSVQKIGLDDVTVDFATADGSALAGADYDAASGSVTLPAGSLLAEVRIPLVGDDLEEPVETFDLVLSNPVGGILLDAEATATVIDDDGWFINGDADELTIPGCIVLTPNQTNRRGSAWRSRKIDLTQSFDQTVRIYLGDSNAGGEGAMFAFQNASTAALGGGGNGLGYTGIRPSVGTELDTNGGSTDHIGVSLNGANNHNGHAPISGFMFADGQEHLLRMIWNAEHQELDVHFEGEEILVYQKDMVGEIFGGASEVWWGLTGSTSSLRNLEYFCEVDVCHGIDADPKVSVGDVRRLEGDGGIVDFMFPVTLSCPTDHPVTVDYLSVDGTATAGSDYQAVTGSLTFAPGETSKSVTVTVSGDTQVEGDELFFLTVENPVGASLRYAAGEGSILTDDVAVVADTPVLVEGNDGIYRYHVPVHLNAPLDVPVSVSYSTRDGSATADVDYQPTSGNLTFPAGESTQTVVLHVVSDREVEGDETLFLDFTGTSGGRFGSSSTQITLFDDDDCGSPNLIRNPSNEEPLVGGNIPFWTEVVGDRWGRMSGGFDGTYKFYAGKLPYAELAQVVDLSSLASVIDAGELTLSFSAVVNSLNQSNPDRSQIVLEFRDASGTALETFDSGQIANRTAWQAVSDVRPTPIGTRTIRIRLITERFAGSQNNGYYDALALRAHPVPTLFTRGDVAVLEGQSQVANQAVFELELNCDAGDPITVDYLTRDATATAGSDYEATFGTLTYQPGERLHTVSVPILGDTLPEGDETFRVEFLSPRGALLVDPARTATILDDESLLSIGDVTVVEGFEGTTAAELPVTLSPAGDQIVTVHYTTNDGTAAAPGDYLPQIDSLTFQPGETEQVLIVQVVGDIEVEGDESFFVDFLEANNAGIGDGRGEITILQDDTSLGVGDVQLLEGAAGATSSAVFRVTLSSPSSLPVTVDYASSDGTATAGSDYTATAGSLSFAAGELEKSITVPVLGDDDLEAGETFFVTLGNAVVATIGQAEGTGFILDDDDCPSPSWLLNSGGDELLLLGEIPSWTEVVGTAWTRRTSSPAPFQGGGYFFPGSAADAELAQDVDLSGFAATIDAGIQRFLFEGFVRTTVESRNDLARIVVDYLTAGGETLLDSFDSGELSTPNTWENVADLRTVPPGTRIARVRLISRRQGSGETNTCYDALALRSLGTPVLMVDDATALEGDATVDLELPVRLSCAAGQTVSVDFTTAPVDATPGVDYDETSGRLDIPAGSVVETVTVPVLGDDEVELRETLTLTLSAPTVAVIFDREALGTIVDDESEPAVDLRVTKLAQPFAVRPGGEVDFLLEVQNRGSEAASGVEITDQLPPFVDFVSAGEGGSYDAGSRTVTWTVTSMAPRQIVRRTLTVRGRIGLPVGETVINTAAVHDDGSLGADQNPEDNATAEPLLLGDDATPLVDPRRAVNLTVTEGVVFGSSSNYSSATYAPDRCGDGDLSTSWFTQTNGSLNRGGNPFWQMTLPRDATVRELRMFGNRESSSGRDIFSGIFRLYDAEDNLLYDSGVIDFPGPTRDVSFAFDEVERVRRLIFTPTADEGSYSGFSELGMIGFYGDLTTGRVPEGTAEDVVASFFDSDPAEAHTALVNWGDGTVEPGVVDEAGGNGTVTGSHLYPDNGNFTVEVCVTDDAGNTGCGSYFLVVENVVPFVDDEGDIDLSTWQTEHYPGNQGLSNWVVAEDGLSVLQTINSRPSIFYGDFPAFGTRITGRIRVETTSDDDFIGFALGFEPGDPGNPDADFLLVDWKQANQDAARAGLALSRVTGTQPSLWAHTTSADFEELARGVNLGSVGWQDFTEYEFTFEFTPNHFRGHVDGVLELDVEGEFADGRFTFYNASQSTVRYSAFGIGAVIADEGEPAVVEAEFTDPGILDTHTAVVNWSDGAVNPGTFATGAEMEMLVRGVHAFADNGEYEAVICVTDNDGGIGCGEFFVGVLNVRPAVDAGPDLTVPFGTTTELSAVFADVGLEDTHTATVDWGDGTVEPAAVTATGPGAGTVSASYLHATIETYTVELCVTDDDGGTGCDSVLVKVVPADPPEDIAITIAPSDEGDTVTLEAVFNDPDPVDEHTATVNWGDGTVPEPVPVIPDGLGGGSLRAPHRYLDDGPFTVEVCVTDAG
ncbi:MAG: DUF11 domain-containing protein, partial [bacterium]|nr:DUF11 domain-containing protein [bacterium]